MLQSIRELFTTLRKSLTIQVLPRVIFFTSSYSARTTMSMTAGFYPISSLLYLVQGMLSFPTCSSCRSQITTKHFQMDTGNAYQRLKPLGNSLRNYCFSNSHELCFLFILFLFFAKSSFLCEVRLCWNESKWGAVTSPGTPNYPRMKKSFPSCQRCT